MWKATDLMFVQTMFDGKHDTITLAVDTLKILTNVHIDPVDLTEEMGKILPVDLFDKTIIEVDLPE